MKIRSVAVALACAAAILRLAGPAPTLRVYDESGYVLATIVVQDGFGLSFIHSINLSPVDEDFSVQDDGSILLERVLYDQMSTGMPSGDENGFMILDGRFCTMPSLRLSEIGVRVSPVPGHMFRNNGTRQPLTRWADVGGLLIFRAAPSY